MDDPTFLGYEYEDVFADLASFVAQRDRGLRTLFIGGGGYAMPRYLEETYPQSIQEVIEIDPEVTRVAFDYLGLRRDTRILTYNEDARMALPKLTPGRYDLIIGDAFNDLAVPCHLTTREFNEQVAALLTAEGIYAVNLVDKFQSGSFLRAFVNTLQQTFPYFYLLKEDANWGDDGRSTHVVVAYFQPFSFEAVERAKLQAGRGEPILNFMPEGAFNAWLASRKNILLTDNYAPVDNMLAAVFRDKHTSPNEATKHYNSAVDSSPKSKPNEAIAEYTESIRLNPRFVLAYLSRGSVYNRMGRYQQALEDFNEAIRLNPGFAPAYVRRGIILVRLGQTELALEDYDEAIQLDPEGALAYNNRGSAHLNLGQYQQAIQDLSQAIRIYPEYGTAYSIRGLAYTFLGKDAEARQDIERAVELGVNRARLEETIKDAKGLR